MWEDTQTVRNCILPTPQQIIDTYEKLDVDKGFLLPVISPESHFCIQTSEEMEFIAKQNPDVFYWFCNIDPRMGDNSPKTDFSYFLEHYKKRGAVGLGEITCNLPFDDPLVENLFYHCEQCDMPITIHIAEKKYGIYGLIDDLYLPGLEKALKKFPTLKILGHSAPFWNEMGDNVTNENRMAYVDGKVIEGRIAKLMRECPNLYCDLSAYSGYNAFTRDSDYSYRFIEEFGDRLMFGTDICEAGITNDLYKWLDESYEKGCISEDNYKNICRKNAIRIFKLDIE